MEHRMDVGHLVRVATSSAMALGTVTLLSGCFVANTVRSEFSSYAEPTGENLAHIRLIGSRNVKVYPNSTCARLDVPGGGYPAGPQLGGQRKRDLGMPKLSDTPKHYVEIAARPDQPIAATFAFYAESHRPPMAGVPGAQGTKTTSGCSVTGSFIPEANANYEARALWAGNRCVVLVSRLTEVQGQMQRLAVAPLSETTCAPAVTGDGERTE